jgi:hypothetical protein
MSAVRVRDADHTAIGFGSDTMRLAGFANIAASSRGVVTMPNISSSLRLIAKRDHYRANSPTLDVIAPTSFSIARDENARNASDDVSAVTAKMASGLHMSEVGRPRDWRWSAEDQATYVAWRRWVLIVYVSIGAFASIAAIALSYGL